VRQRFIGMCLRDRDPRWLIPGTTNAISSRIWISRACRELVRQAVSAHPRLPHRAVPGGHVQHRPSAPRRARGGRGETIANQARAAGQGEGAERAMSQYDTFAEAIAHMEGFYIPGSRAQRNNNPGNLNLEPWMERKYGAVLETIPPGVNEAPRFARFVSP